MQRTDDTQVTQIMREVLLLIAGFGALTASAVSALTNGNPRIANLSLCSVRCYLRQAESAGLVKREGEEDPCSPLYVMETRGLLAIGLKRPWTPCNVSKYSAHLSGIARIAAVFSARYGCEVIGERAVRRYEWAHRGSIASANMQRSAKPRHPMGSRLLGLHRADLVVLVPGGGSKARYLAVEYERSRKSVMRDLRPNVTAWANCTDVEKVLYVIPSAAHEVRADVQRMIRTLNAEDKILVVTEKDFLSGNCLAVDRLCVARAGQTAPAASSPRVHAGIARGGRDGGGRTRGSHSRGAIADRSRLARMLS